MEIIDAGERILIIDNKEILLNKQGEDNDHSKFGEYVDYWICEECSDGWQ